MSIIVMKDVSKYFNRNEESFCVFKRLNLEIKKGEFVCILGNSGCGKTTLLNIILGAIKCTEGKVIINGKEKNGINSDCAIVFQEASLFQWLNVIQNVKFSLKMKGLNDKQCEKIAQNYLNMVHLGKYRDYYVHELSGGMKQRVTLARALASETDIMLLDEPFSSLDVNNKQDLQHELLEIWEQTGKTVIMVTHSSEEASFLASRIITISSEFKNIKEDYYVTGDGYKGRLQY